MATGEASAARSPSVVDLFSGVGGLSLGAARAGFKVAAAVELDDDAYRAHEINFPGTAHLKTDVATLSGAEVRKALGCANAGPTGVIGGPPCQGFSVLGRRQVTDPRNQLFEHFFRLVAELRPRFFLAENVPGILAPTCDNIRKTALDRVRAAYDVLDPLVVTASDYGAPTSRTRVFFIGVLKDVGSPLTHQDFAPEADVRAVKVSDALKGLPPRIRPEWIDEASGWRRVRAEIKGAFADRLSGMVPSGVGSRDAIRRLRDDGEASGNLGTAHSKAVAARYAALKPNETDPVTRSRRLNADGFCPTLRAGTGKDKGRFQAVRPIHPTQARVITPREAARLQGFPDWFQFSPTKWHSFRMIGNSVSPIVAEAILRTLFTKAAGKE